MKVNYKFAVAHRVAQVLFSAGTLLLVSIYFTPVEVGLYYLLMSFMSFQVMFEMGLGQALIQVASHISRKNRLSSEYHVFINNIDFYYKAISFKYFFSSIILGLPYIIFFVPGDYYYSIFTFIIMTASTAAMLRISYKHSILESRGLVGYSSRLKFAAVILAAVILWVCIYLQFGLYSVGLSIVGGALYLNLALRKIPICELCGTVLYDNSNKYSNELEALQSRYKLSYISGYIASYTIVPIVFAMISPVDAGRLGLTLSVFSAVTIISSVFTVVNNAKMANLISNRKFNDLNLLYVQSFKYVLSAAIFLGTSACVFLFILRALFPLVADKFLNFELILLLFISSVASALIYSMAIYLRAHKIELLVGASIVSAISVLIVVIVGSLFGLKYVVYGYSMSCTFIALPLTYIIFKRKFDENSIKINLGVDC